MAFRNTVIQSSLSSRESAAQFHSRFDVRSLNAFCTTTLCNKRQQSRKIGYKIHNNTCKYSLLTTSMVQVEKSVQCMFVCLCVCRQKY